MILKQIVIDEIEQHLNEIRAKTPQVQALLAIVDKSKLFHLKMSVSRARKAAHKALAGNEIDYATWDRIQKHLDAVLSEKEATNVQSPS